MLTETVPDVLKEIHGDKAKVFGLSLKDRSAILPCGKRPDGVFWFDGSFVTSTYYTDKLDRRIPNWVKGFNDSHSADRWFGKDWDRFRADLDYQVLAGPDDVRGEGVGEGSGTRQGRIFPHPTTGGLQEPGSRYYSTLANSPFGNELLLSFAQRCIASENLGRDEVPDLLVVSFSSNDLIGHTWGPDSQEVFDATLRSDAMLAEFLKTLDRTVGKGNYALALTADHGICPLPEVHGGTARRVPAEPIRTGAEAHLRSRFGSVDTKLDRAATKATSGWIEAISLPWIYLNQKLVAKSGRSQSEIARELANYLEKQDDVARAFTREDLAGNVNHDEIAQRVKRSYYPERSGDVYLLLEPFDLFSSKSSETGTTHGTPYSYDTHVPLMVLGPGVRGGAKSGPVTPQAAAAILSRFLGIRQPSAAEFPVPSTLMSR